MPVKPINCKSGIFSYQVINRLALQNTKNPAKRKKAPGRCLSRDLKPKPDHLICRTATEDDIVKLKPYANFIL
jgi:hypothetical protein